MADKSPAGNGAAFSAKPFPGGNSAVENVATKLRKRMLTYVAAPPVGPFAVRKFLDRCVSVYGGTIQISRTPSWLESDGGSLTIESGGKPFVIRLSPTTSPLRDNFTIAHELGHFFLHYPHRAPHDQPVSFNRYGVSTVEQQANVFASAFLMPRDEISPKRNRPEQELASYFGVSVSAVQVRLKTLF